MEEPAEAIVVAIADRVLELGGRRQLACLEHAELDVDVG